MKLKRKSSRNRQHHNLWRHAKADGQNARADSRGDEQLMAIFEYMTPRVPWPEIRRLDRSADQWKVNLSTMCVGCQQERDTPRKAGKDVRIVRHCNYG